MIAFVLFIEQIIRKFPPGEDGNSCVDTKCEDGMVCVQSQTGSKCMPVNPANNCDTMRCYVGSTCEYQDTECIPDKACFAEPMCKRGGPQKPPPEQNPDMVNNNNGPGTQSDVPKGGESASPREWFRCSSVTLPPKIVTGPPAPNTNPCASISCGAGATCQNVDGKAMCTAPPNSTGAAQPPCLAKCSANERCVLSSDDSSCYNPPCPPVPTCVKVYIQPPRPVGKR
ncbi:hypothetical protein Aduo_016324 [Ancylostoma duodenale]